MGLENWWQDKTRLEKGLIVFVAVLCFVVFVLFIVLLLNGIAGSGVCHHPECVRSASHILDTIDPSVDPCDNFYNFACGNFLKNAFALGYPSTLHHLNALMKNKLKEIVTEATDEGDLSKTLRTQRKFYRACMNETAIEEDNDKTFLKLLDVVAGGWPVLKSNAWVEAEFKWESAVVKAKRLGLFFQFFFRVDVYSEENGTSTLWIKPPSAVDVATFYKQEQNLDLIHEIAAEWGPTSVQVLSELRRTMYFADQIEQMVKNYYNKTTTHEPDTDKKVALKNLDHKWLKISWIELLRHITDIPLKEDDLVIFDAEDYFTDFSRLILTTSKRIQANYIAWTAISTNVNYMTKRIRDKFKLIETNSNGKAANQSRSDWCYKLSVNLFQHVAEGEYIRRYTPPEKREYIKEIIKNVKQEMIAALQENPWMDETTKNYAMNHLRNASESIGWTDIVYDVKTFEATFGYHNLDIKSDNPIDIARKVSLSRVNHHYEKINQMEEDEDLLNSPKLDVNAYYLQYFNRLILPTSILQGQMMNERRPHYMNYGSLGSIIGHELTHGLTEYSPAYGGSEASWWTNTTRSNFKNVTKCLVDEYDNYPEQLSDFNRNGSVLEENLADFSGVNFAYAAYQSWVRKNGQEDILPGLKYTPNQVFWIMTSIYSCFQPKLAQKNETAMREAIHAVPSFRVIGSLRNSPYFAHDFNCPAGSRMNPEKKCRVFN